VFIRQLGGGGNVLCYDAIFLFPTVVILIAEVKIPRAVVLWGSDLFCIGKEKKFLGEKIRRG